MENRMLIFGRFVSVTDIKNGKFAYETNRDEGGYVTAENMEDAIERIGVLLNRADERWLIELDEIAESLDPDNQ